MSAVPLLQRVFASLADGTVHSGESLAAAHGVTRSAVWKAIEALRQLGLDIEAATHRGYRIAPPTEALDPERIRGATSAFRHLAVEWTLPSTNTALLERPPPPPGVVDALLVEQQTAGRGRRGRSWLAPVGGCLCLSLSTQFESPPPGIGALPLCVGMACVAALTALGAKDLGLKWPNDLVRRADGAKVAGILIELRAEAGGPSHVVVGIGINTRLPTSVRSELERGGVLATDLAQLGVDASARNRIAAGVLDAVASNVLQFATAGFAPFVPRWAAVDTLRDRPVVISGSSTALAEGIARGIDPEGCLQIDDAAGRRHKLMSGEVSIRRAAA